MGGGGLPYSPEPTAREGAPRASSTLLKDPTRPAAAEVDASEPGTPPPPDLPKDPTRGGGPGSAPTPSRLKEPTRGASAGCEEELRKEPTRAGEPARSMQGATGDVGALSQCRRARVRTRKRAAGVLRPVRTVSLRGRRPR